MDGDFARRVKAFSRKHKIPLQYCEIGDKDKYQKAEKARPKDANFQGIFLIKTIFGRKHRPHKTRVKTDRLEKILDCSVHNLTVFKVHFGRLTLKMYDKGERETRGLKPRSSRPTCWSSLVDSSAAQRRGRKGRSEFRFGVTVMVSAVLRHPQRPANELRTRNSERRTANGERRTPNGERLRGSDSNL